MVVQLFRLDICQLFILIFSVIQLSTRWTKLFSSESETETRNWKQKVGKKKSNKKSESRIHKLEIRHRKLKVGNQELTRPIRPTMRPHDHEMILGWYDYMRHHYLRSKSSIFPFSTKAWPADRPTDRRTDKLGYRDARTHLKRQNNRQKDSEKKNT